VNEQIVTTYIKSQGSATVVGPIVNPCLPPNTSWKNVRVKVQDGTATKDGPSTKEMTVDFVGPTEPSTSQCRKIAEMILKKDEICQLEPCSFNGVHQPSLVDSFMKDSDVFIFSFFYDRTFPLGMPSSFSVDELKDLTAKVCKGKSVYDSFEAIDVAVQQLEENPQWCLDLSYMVAILHTGYDIPVHREVKIAKKIKQNELGWCLGASLPLLDSKIGGWTCKVKEHY
jgi:guanosine-diphosphatase